MDSISRALSYIKENWNTELSDEAITAVCRDEGLTWRGRLLTPVVTIRLFLLQIVHGNTACSHLPRLAQMAFSAQAYCEARKRLPLAVLQKLLERTVSCWSEATRDTGHWLGHRVFLIDGSSFSTPDTPALQGKFGLPANQKPGCGFPTAHWLALMHGTTGLIRKVLVAPLKTHDARLLPDIHPELQPGDVLVGDRAFCFFAHFVRLSQRGVHGLFRVNQQIVDFTPHRPHATKQAINKQKGKGLPRSRWLKALGANDQLVEWFRPRQASYKATPEQKAEFALLPASIILREVRFRISRKGFRVCEVTLATTLLDPAVYSAQDLAELYLARWKIETNFQHIKTTMGMDMLHCKTVDGILKEFTMFVLVYNLVRLTMHTAAEQQGVPHERISFIDALRWFMDPTAEGPLSELRVHPARPPRAEPRVIKRRPKRFPNMTKPRSELRQALEQPSLAS